MDKDVEDKQNVDATETELKLEADVESQDDFTQREPEVDLQAELDKSKNDYLYLRADFENYRKKAIAERSQSAKYAAEPVLRELLGIIDNFDLALMTEVNAETLDSFHQGIKMIRQEFSASLEKAGVREIESKGLAFDPNLHEALGAEESAEVNDGHILREFKKAYKLHDRLLRPGQVIIAKKPAG